MTDGAALVRRVALQHLSILDQAEPSIEASLQSGKPEMVGLGFAFLARLLQRSSELMATGMGLDVGELREREADGPPAPGSSAALH